MLSFQQIFGFNSVNTFSFSGDNLAPQGAICVATEQVGWCVLLVNFTNNGYWSSGRMISTFVKDGTVWTGNHGDFKIVSSLNGVEARDGPVPPTQLCANQCGGGASEQCRCNPGSGCYCCTGNLSPISGCTQVTGMGITQYLQSTMVFNGIVWFIASSNVAIPESVCSVNAQMEGTLCLFFKNLSFSQGGISGYAYMVYTTQHSSNETNLGFFRIN